ncbi:MAG TPA: cytochrome P450 [Kofleriaceae bacterium]|jgi:cytochrome P450|nr:cytochrome P450 [Kofleriaceae bacterium]
MREPGIRYPPGPRTPAVVQTAAYIRDPLTALERWANRHGDLFTVRIAGFGNVVFAAAPREIRQIFTADPDELQAGAANGQLVPLLGPQSLLVLDGRGHHRHRRLLLPPFHGERMASYAVTVRDATLRSIDRWPRGQAFALHPYLLGITLEAILRTVFGIVEPARIARFAAVFSDLIGRWSSPLLPLLAFYGIDPIRLAPWLPVARRKRELDRMLHDEIARRRAAGEGADMLGLLLAARDERGEPLSADELRDELVTLMVAGHETSATALAWAIERVLVHPTVIARLRDELATVTHGGELDVTALDRLVYLDAVVRETLRLRPILAFVARRTTAPFAIGEYRVPRGTFVCPAIHLAHARAESYPEPRRFLPERFLGKKLDPYAWLPFGGGGRRCLGMAFALFEIKLVLATVLSTVELRLEAGAPLARTLRGITVAPAGGTRVVVSPARGGRC